MSADKSTSSDSCKPLEGLKSAKTNDDPFGLSTIDQRIDRLKSQLSPVPYLLDLPSDRPYNAPPQQANDWRLTWRQNHPFHHKEKALQYMSYHHLEWEDSLLRPIGNWDNGNGRIMEEGAAKAEGLQSGPGTPLLTASTSTKKTTLKDYLGRKGKQESSATPSHAHPPNEDLQKKEEADDKVNGLRNTTEKSDHLAKGPKETGQMDGEDEKAQVLRTVGKKRALDSSQDSHHEHSVSKQDTERPQKKARLGSPIQEVSSKTMLKPDHSETPRISTSPPSTSSGKLPKLISPTLPPALESELRKIPSLTNGLGHKKTESINSVSSEGKRSKPQNLLEKPVASPKPKPTTPLLTNGVKESSKATPSPSFKVGATSGKGHKPSDSDISQKSVHLNGLKSSSLHEHKEAKPEKKERRIIKLKYGRRNKQAVRRILGMTAQPKKVIDEAPARKAKEEDLRGQKERPSKPHDVPIKSPLPRPEKRPRPADHEESSSQPPKRQKHPAPSSLNLSDKPRTPIPAPFKSPAFSKAQFSTPKKDLKSVAMRRVDSGDGDVRTPSGARAGTPTAPNSIERGALAKTSPPNTSGSLDTRQEQKRQWRLEAAKYEQLARSLKHQADKHLKTKEGPSAHVSEEEAKLGAVTALETILCYMLSFFATDQATQISTGKHASDASAWLSIISYWYFVRERVEAFTDLHGLCLQIGALCRETICALDMEKLAQDPLPKTSGDGISPPSDAGHLTPNSAKVAQYHREYVDFKARMVSNFHKSKALWTDGTRDLSLQKIKEDYPKTWALQESDNSGRGKEKFTPGRYEGGFYLPLGGTSSSIEGARFGWKLLEEWCGREGVRWERKIGL